MFAKKNKYSYGDIVGKEKLTFHSQDDLKSYYDKKYTHDGYERGYVVQDVPISQIYHSYRRKYATQLLRPSLEKIILDIGCGDGLYTKSLSSRYQAVHGIDVSPSAISLANKDGDNDCTFQQSFAEKLPYQDEYFDEVVSIETVEHVLKPDEMLAEAWRVIKPGGALVITFPVFNYNYMWRLERILHIRQWKPISEHLLETSNKDFCQMVQQHGFVHQKSLGIVFAMPLPFIWLTDFFARTVRLRIALEGSITAFPNNSLFVVYRFEKPQH